MNKRKALPKAISGVSIHWSPINRAYIILWGATSVLRVITDREAAIAEFNRITK